MPALTAPRSPSRRLPPRAAGAWRRICCLDVTEAGDNQLRISAFASDSRDAAAHAAEDVAALTATVSLAGGRWLEELEVEPATAVNTLVGTSLGPGFRARAAQVVDTQGRDPLSLLLFDLPTMVYLNGYAVMRRLTVAGEDPGEIVRPDVLPTVIDVCSGWRSGGTMARSIAAGQGVPLQDAPLAPDLGVATTDAAPGAIRRERVLDLVGTLDEGEVTAVLRDTYRELSGRTVVLHEYALTVGFRGGAVEAIQAEPHVLPFGECPEAVERLDRLVGTRVGDLRAASSRRLAGIDGCTHLNDLVATLDHLPLAEDGR